MGIKKKVLVRYEKDIVTAIGLERYDREKKMSMRKRYLRNTRKRDMKETIAQTVTQS